jgi:hypothetical protein
MAAYGEIPMAAVTVCTRGCSRLVETTRGRVRGMA